MYRYDAMRASLGPARKGRQYNPFSKAENVAFAVLASIWFTALFLVGKDIDLGVHSLHSEQGSTGHLHLDGTVALLHAAAPSRRSSSQAPLQQDKPLEWYQQLHNRPALATRNSSITYPVVQWPLYDDTQFLPPDDEELGRGLHANWTYENASNPYMVVAYNGSFFGQTWPTHALNCSVPCVMTSDIQKYAKRADVLVFHAVDLDWDEFWQIRKPDQQLWALHSMESQEAYTIQQAASPLMNRIDIQATYKMSPVRPGLHHVPVSYLNKGEYTGFTLKRPQMYNKTGLALWMHNNCDAVSSRERLVQQLMQLMPQSIDSPGKCLHNKDAGGMNTAAPVDLIAQYKFYFVFENVFGDPDWVSSTFFRALDAGTVPVYLGAPNILKFAPGERSIIRACDFDSMEQLAEYLMYLDRNNTAYREYLEWKETGPSPEFQSLMGNSDMTPWCQMCIAAAQKKMHAYDSKMQDVLVWHYKMKLAFDVLNAQLDQESSRACRGKEPWWQVKLSEEEEARLFQTHVKVVRVPEEFGGSILMRETEPAVA